MHVVSAVSCPGQKSKEHCGCAVSGKPGQASGTFTMVSPKKRAPQVRARPPVPWAAASNAAIESVPSGRKRNSHKQATSSPTSPAPQPGLVACFSHDHLAPSFVPHLARRKCRLSPLRFQHPGPGTRFDTIGVGNI